MSSDEEKSASGPGATLAEAGRVADALQFACRLPDRTPDFFACGGPAAEAYWNYFTPARVSSLLAAVGKVLELHKPEWVDGRNADGDEFSSHQCMECDTGGVRDNWPCATFAAIAAGLA